MMGVRRAEYAVRKTFLVHEAEEKLRKTSRIGGCLTCVIWRPIEGSHATMRRTELGEPMMCKGVTPKVLQYLLDKMSQRLRALC